MLDLDRKYTTDDLTDAYWMGYAAARADGKLPRRPVPRGWYLLAAVAACVAFWACTIWLFAAML